MITAKESEDWNKNHSDECGIKGFFGVREIRHICPGNIVKAFLKLISINVIVSVPDTVRILEVTSPYSVGIYSHIISIPAIKAQN